MSIIIHIDSPQNKEKFTYQEDSLPCDENVTTINLPKLNNAKSNDISKLEVSINSSKYSKNSKYSKYTLSGDDMNSNMSLENSPDKKEKYSFFNNNFNLTTTKTFNNNTLKTFKSSDICEQMYSGENNNNTEKIIYEEMNRLENSILENKK